MAQERKLVTVLFADIVGSTAVTGQHDPEVVRASLNEVFTRIERVLTSHGATVEKFIGDAVMAVFGIPSAHDDDADRAVRAAFAIRKAIASFPNPDGRSFELRIGIDTGDAVAGGREAERVLVTGEPVIAGARLQQAAAPGEILVGALTHRLTLRGVSYEPARHVDAKGIGVLEAWPATAITTSVPEAHRGLEGLRAPLIGRDKEMRLLRDAYARLASEQRAYLVTVFGTPGSGKSRLTDEFVASLAGVRVRHGRCLPYGDGITFYPLMLIIRADAGIVPSDSKDEALAKLRTAVSDAFVDSPDGDAVLARVSVIAGLAQPEEAMPVASENVAEELRWGVRRYLERRAGAQPMVIVFEDIHWAEPALLDAIEQIAEWSRAPLFLLCLARPDLREQRPSWGGGATNAAAMDLSPLSAEDTRSLIAELLSLEALPETLRSEIVSRAEGNPLYVEEFLRMLIEREDIGRREGEWVALRDLSALAIPPTLQGLITARLDRVSREVKQILQRASLPGRTFSTAALAALGDGTPPANELLREATRRDLLIEVDERAVGGGRVFRFKHALIRDVAYSTLPKGERARLHDRYGRWLEETLGERGEEIVDVIAYQAEQAYLIAKEVRLGHADLAKRAFALLRRAALNAHHRHDRHGARSLFRRAAATAASAEVETRDVVEIQGFLSLLERRIEMTADTKHNVQRALETARAGGPSEILVQLLEAASWGDLGNSEKQRLAAEAAAMARGLGDPELIAEVALTVAQLAPTMKESYRILKESHEAQVASGARRWLPFTLSYLGLVAANLGKFSEGFRYREEALRLARASGSRLLVAEALWRLGHGLEHTGDLLRGLAVADESLALIKEVAIPMHVMQSLHLRGLILDALGEYERARADFQEVFDNAAGVGMRNSAAIGLVHSYLRDGQVAVAEQYLPEKFESTGQDVPPMHALLLATRAQIRAARGEDARAEALFREALTLFDAEGDGYWRAEAKRAYARFLIARGRGREAREHVDWLLRYYAEPIAERRRREAEDLLTQCEALTG